MNAASPQRPVRELLGRYKSILGAAWAQRHELQGPQRLADEAAFLPAALSLQDTPVHPAPRRLAYAIIALFVVAVTWACFGEIDIVAVAPGRIVVSERTKLIQPLETSVVKRVLVRDGDHVQAGQVLVELDPTLARADKTSMDEVLKASQSDLLRARALLQALQGGALMANWPATWTSAQIQSAQTQLHAEWSDIAAKLAKLAAERNRRQAEITTVRAMVAKLDITIPMSRQREEDFKKLSDQGFMAPHAGQDRMRERIELERDLATQKARLAEAVASLEESDQARASYVAEVQRSLHAQIGQAELRRLQSSQEYTKAAQREKLTTLTAPVAGTVQQLAAHTANGIATEAQVLMVIVPEGASVTAEVTLENKDIGFVKAGQEAAIKLETFSYTRYGTVNAEVARVTSDAVNDEKRGAIFPATLNLKSQQMQIDGKRIALSPGMNLTAEIKTGKRRIIEYLISPIQRAGSESLRER